MRFDILALLFALTIASVVASDSLSKRSPSHGNPKLPSRSTDEKSDAEKVSSTEQPDERKRKKRCFKEIPPNLNSSSLKDNPRSGERGPALPNGVEPSAGCTICKSSLAFPNNGAAKKYEVGNQIPTLPFRTKTSWAGNINITGADVSKDASLYFWLWGKDDSKESDDLVIWLSGGPGCSSVGAMIQENGPFLYLDVREKPFVNGYSWTKAANMLFVDQPVPTGFSTGTTRNVVWAQVAEQFVGFLEGFFKIFPELSKKNLYIVGESYGGAFVPSLADYIYNNSNKFNLKSGMTIDGIFTESGIQTDAGCAQFAKTHQMDLKLNTSDLAEIQAESDKCGATALVDKYLKYPPPGKMPPFGEDCSVGGTLNQKAVSHNEDYYIYNVKRNSPYCESPLGDSTLGKAVYSQPVWLDNVDIQRYIHAPEKKYVQCKIGEPFPLGSDESGPLEEPTFEKNLLRQAIEKSSRPFVIVNGDLDARSLTNGTSLALQNMTWNNVQGFTKSPYATTAIDTDGKDAGYVVSERGLIYAIAKNAGHLVPLDDPSFGLAALQVLIGARNFTK